MSKKNEVAQATSTEVSTAQDFDWGSNEASSSDIVIPKIQLMQGMSKKVLAGQARLGDFLDSVTGEVLGNAEKPVEVTPFHMEKFFVVQKEVRLNNGKIKFEYSHIEKIGPHNENSPWEFEVEGVKHKRVYTRNFYVLIEGKVLPYVIGFSSTSAKAGKELATEMYVKNTMMKKAPAATKIAIGCDVVSNDDGTYAVKKIKPVRPSSPDEIALAFQWFQTVRKEETKVDASDDF